MDDKTHKTEPKSAPKDGKRPIYSSDADVPEPRPSRPASTPDKTPISKQKIAILSASLVALCALVAVILVLILPNKVSDGGVEISGGASSASGASDVDFFETFSPSADGSDADDSSDSSDPEWSSDGEELGDESPESGFKKLDLSVPETFASEAEANFVKTTLENYLSFAFPESISAKLELSSDNVYSLELSSGAKFLVRVSSSDSKLITLSVETELGTKLFEADSKFF